MLFHSEPEPHSFAEDGHQVLGMTKESKKYMENGKGRRRRISIRLDLWS